MSGSNNIAPVDVDEAYSIAAGEEEIDSVYFDVAQDDQGDWYMSAIIDSDTGSFVDSLTTDDGPYTSEEMALRAGIELALTWMRDNDYTDYEVDSRLQHLAQTDSTSRV